MPNNNSFTQSRKNILFIAQFGILLAIEAIVCFTPLGSLPAIGPIVATLSHIPVIITAIVLSTGAGAAMGFFFGLFSFIVWTFMPPSPIAFVFTPFYSVGEIGGNFLSLVICFVPRILIGVVAGALSQALYRVSRNRFVAYSISGVAASLTNTFLVLGGMYLFFGQEFAAVNNLKYELVLGVVGMTILTSGIPEAILGGIVAYAVGSPLVKMNSKMKQQL
ncbi:MAG TPA: ECF transporter S component [Candidatus Avimonas sp.]|nr:ECF transporter S component [Clostridiales bacterium]HPU58721.1 ECF transporter S component [Candidatus Avimonas sp.]